MKSVYQQCEKINSVGQRCSHSALRGSNMCAFHDPSRRRKCLAWNETTGEICARMPMKGKNVCSTHLRQESRYEHIVQKSETQEIQDIQQAEDPTPLPDPILPFLEITDAKEFAKAILDSQLFREYIVDGLRSRTIPSNVILRLMDYADGWGKPAERVEHTGSVVTEVRRVVIRVNDNRSIETEDEPVAALPPHGTIN